MSEFIRLGKAAGTYVVLKEDAGKALGVAVTIVEGDALLIDRLARNRSAAAKGVGGELLLVVETELAPQLGIAELRLEAMNEDLVAFYRRFGFVEAGARFRDDEGWLYPMRKRLR